MNFIPPDLCVSASPAPNLTHEVAHIWRSRIVDKFADAERQVLRLSKLAGGHAPAKALFSQKVDGLLSRLDGKTGPVRASKVRPLLEKLAPMAVLRSELVHLTLSVAKIEGEQAVVVRYSAEEPATEDHRKVLTLPKMKSCHAELSNIVNGLRQEVRIAEERAESPLSRG